MIRSLCFALLVLLAGCAPSPPVAKPAPMRVKAAATVVVSGYGDIHWRGDNPSALELNWPDWPVYTPYKIEYSTDLVTWTSFISAPGEPRQGVTLIDMSLSDIVLFYRLVPN